MEQFAPKSTNIVTIDEKVIKDHLGELVRESVEETLNGLLDQEAPRLCNAEKYERKEGRRDTRDRTILYDAILYYLKSLMSKSCSF